MKKYMRLAHRVRSPQEKAKCEILEAGLTTPIATNHFSLSLQVTEPSYIQVLMQITSIYGLVTSKD